MSDAHNLRIGTGLDVHAFAPGRKLVLGGVEIPYELGLLGHSDADVLCHAIADALLSAARLPDIGELFPNTDPAYKDASSIALLRDVASRVREKGFEICDCDATLAAEKPKLSPYKNEMRAQIAQALDLDLQSVGIKATTFEGLGFVGRAEGIGALASVLLEKTGA